MRALNRYFDPQLNPDYERFRLRQTQQADKESINMFHAILRRLASTCTDVDWNDEIRAQLIQSCKSNTLRKRILQQPKIALAAILVMAQS